VRGLRNIIKSKAKVLLALLSLTSLLLLGACAQLPSFLYQPYDLRAGFVSEADAYFIQEINRQRTDRGLPALQVYKYLDSKLMGKTPASQWAKWTAKNQRLIHSSQISEGMPPNCQVGENMGRGSDPARIMQAFLDSRTHRANILRKNFTQMVSVTYRNKKGIYYTCHRFVSPPQAGVIIR